MSPDHEAILSTARTKDLILVEQEHNEHWSLLLIDSFQISPERQIGMQVRLLREINRDVLREYQQNGRNIVGGGEAVPIEEHVGHFDTLVLRPSIKRILRKMARTGGGDDEAAPERIDSQVVIEGPQPVSYATDTSSTAAVVVAASKPPRFSTHKFEWYQCARERVLRDICGICHSGYKKGESIADLTCEHFFHEGCMWEHVRFQRGTASCPLCKQSLVAQ